MDRHSSIPLYYQLKEYIIKKIDDGDYPPGEKIPSELDLCNKLGISRPTVRQAIAELVAEGRLNIVKGKGTFVTSSEMLKEISGFSAMTFSFFEGGIDSYENIEDLGSAEAEDIFKRWHTGGNELSYYQKGALVQGRKRLEGSLLYGYSKSYIPLAVFPDLKADLEMQKSMIDITANKYAYLPVKGRVEISVIPANPEISKMIDVARGTPVLLVTAVLFSRGGAISEIVYTYLRSDACRISF